MLLNKVKLSTGDNPEVHFLNYEEKEKIELILNWDYDLLILDLFQENQDFFLTPISEPEELDIWFKKILKFNFWINWYIKLEIIWNILKIDMIDMPNKWNESMLFIIKYALENWVKNILWEANPRKKISKNMDRRLKILVDFYTWFWFIPNIDSWTWWKYMSLDFREKKLLEVIYNKLWIYLKTKNWPTLRNHRKFV